MRPSDEQLAKQLDGALLRFHQEQRPLPGIQDFDARRVFVEQLVESVRRVRYIEVVKGLAISETRLDPNNPHFHPIKGAILKLTQGDLEEAYWLVFLSVHFGRHRRTGWRLLRDIYGGLGQGVTWNWLATSSDPRGFRTWLAANIQTLKGGDGIPRHFGNHRKYQSLDPWKQNGTGDAVESYINWVFPVRSQHQKFLGAIREANGDALVAFDNLYRSLSVASFGRTAKFDFLTMVGKIGLVEIAPPKTYMGGATGPLSGARLLFGGALQANLHPTDLETWLVQLGPVLGVGMQVLEDALCNWQKSPKQFRPFRG